MDRWSKNQHMKRVVNIKDSLPFIDEADINMASMVMLPSNAGTS